MRGEQETAEVVQIWHRSNWHWYLKQEQVYTDAQAVTVVWDEVVPLRLHICSGAAWYRQVRHRAVTLNLAVQSVGKGSCTTASAVGSVKCHRS